MNPRQLLLILLLVSTPDIASAQFGCWVGMGGIQFGNVSSIGAPATTTGIMWVGCSNGTLSHARVCLELGAPVDASWDPRYMVSWQGDRLAYNIYADDAHSQIWGSSLGSPGAPVAVDIPLSYGTGNATIPYHARVLSQGNAPPNYYHATFVYAVDATVRAVEYDVSPPQCNAAVPIVSRFEFDVSATIISDCSISASTLAFGATGSGLADTPVTAQSTITMTCSQGLNYAIALDSGIGSGATFAMRNLTRDGGTETLHYQLYRDASRTQAWGDGSAGTSTLSGTGAGAASPRVHTVYGTLPAQAPPPVGDYRDVVTVTVTY